MRIRPGGFGCQATCEGGESESSRRDRHPWRARRPPRRPEASLTLGTPEVRPAGSQGAARGTPRPTHVMATAWGIHSPDDPAGGGPLARGPPAPTRRPGGPTERWLLADPGIGG